MSRRITRIVTALLIGSFIADPARAIALSLQQTTRGQPVASAAPAYQFSEQALSAQALTYLRQLLSPKPAAEEIDHRAEELLISLRNRSVGGAVSMQEVVGAILGVNALPMAGFLMASAVVTAMVHGASGSLRNGYRLFFDRVNTKTCIALVVLIISHGAWTFSKAQSSQPKRTANYQTTLQHENLDQYAAITKALLSRTTAAERRAATDAARNAALAGTFKITRSGDRSWETGIKDFYPELWVMLVQLRRTGGSADSAWAIKYMTLIQNFNEHTLFERGWMVLPVRTAAEGYVLAKVQGNQPLRATYKGVSGNNLLKVMRMTKGEVLSVAQVEPGLVISATDINGLTTGLSGHETVFINPTAAKSDFNLLNSILDPGSTVSKDWNSRGLGKLRENSIQALQRTGWVRDNRLLPGFLGVLDQRAVVHEGSHGLHLGPEGFAASRADEPYMWLHDMTGSMRHVVVATMVMIANYEDRTQRANGFPSDRMDPLATPEYPMTRGLWELAKAAGNPSLARRIAQYRTDAEIELETILLGDSDAQFDKVVQTAMSSLKLEIPGPSEWTIQVAPAPAPPRTAPAAAQPKTPKANQFLPRAA